MTVGGDPDDDDDTAGLAWGMAATPLTHCPPCSAAGRGLQGLPSLVGWDPMGHLGVVSRRRQR